MSIGVRVSVVVLGVLVFLCAGVAALTYLQKQTLQEQNQGLQTQISKATGKIDDLTAITKKLQDEEAALNTKIFQAQQEKNQVQNLYDDLKHKSEAVQAQLNQANTDRDDWKTRVATITQERDALVQKLKNQPAKVVYKDRLVPTAAGGTTVDVASAQGDQYWASVLRQKAVMQVELEKEKFTLDQAALQVAELRKQNSDLELEIKQVTNDKDEIIQKIKYGQDIADNLSIDLARSRNDQQAVNDRATRLRDQNYELLSQVKELSSTKVQLEKTISRLTDDKDAMQKKLIETESVIQSRIDDIWKIKQGLDKKLAENAPNTVPTNADSSAGSMELPPIVVNASNGQQTSKATESITPATPTASTAPIGKTEGQIISINESNNFVIVDLGQENSSVSIGNAIKVYRNSTEIATLEVIQVRRDICAADIKDKTIELKVGDVAKLI